MSKILGYGIIFGATMVKFPQILTLVLSKSGEGIVMSMFYMQLIGSVIEASYNVHIGTPFSVYGESIFLSLQTVVIIMLIWYYEKTYSLFEKL